MRVRSKATPEQRAALRAQLARLQQPAALLEILQSSLPAGFEPTEVRCIVPSVHPNRFVLRAGLRSNHGEEHAYALKVYCDDFGRRVWEHSQLLAKHHRPNHSGLCLASRYVPHERMLVFPWVDGPFLSEIVDDHKPELLREAARVAAELHRLPVVPEHLTTAQMFVDETLFQCDHLRSTCPEAAALVEPLAADLQQAATGLDPAAPALVHGDMAPGQFLWTGHGLVLLDLDMFGYADPAYDVGHFLGQMERRSVVDPTVRVLTREWLVCFRDAYLATMPHVSQRNVSFYRGLTLVRKISTTCRREPVNWPELVPGLADRARAAFEQAQSDEIASSRLR